MRLRENGWIRGIDAHTALVSQQEYQLSHGGTNHSSEEECTILDLGIGHINARTFVLLGTIPARPGGAASAKDRRAPA